MPRHEVYIANILKCRPPNNRDPLPDEAEACFKYLDAQLKFIKPALIVTLGRHSMERFLPGFKISEIHGQTKMVQGIFSDKQIIFPLYHPAAALYNPALRTTLIADMKKLQQRPDLQALRMGVEIREQEIKESRTAFYPELFTRLSLDYLENDKLREQAIYGASVGLKINLFDGFSSTATRSKVVAQKARAKEQVRLAEEQARLEAATASNDLNVAFERIAVTQESIRQGEENLRINRNRYQERVGTATEVLDAQTLLTQAKTEHYRAQYDYQRSAARLRRATGEL
jgi:outer membrane protein TolC